MAGRIHEEATDTWDDRVAVDRFTGKGGHFIRGRARLTGPGEVTVDTPNGQRVLRASRGVVIAAGTEPATHPSLALAGTPYLTNREAVETERVPDSLIVLGGGAIGAELAQVFARFGAVVTVVEALAGLLPAGEPETSELLAAVFAREGIGVRTGVLAERVGHDCGRFAVSLADGGTLTSSRLLVAAGRRTDLAALGVVTAGIDDTAGFIATDPGCAPSATSGRSATSPARARSPMSRWTRPVSPSGTSSASPGRNRITARCRGHLHRPRDRAAGLTEAQARDQGMAVRTGTSSLPS